jgi:hypothetical protein
MNIYSKDTYFEDMDSQPKSELSVSKVGRPRANFLREGVPSKICFLCYGRPLSTYEVAMTLYDKPRPNVQNWMKKLGNAGYLVRMKREVQRDTGKRPKGEMGFQLVASKIVDELGKTLVQNTSGLLTFSTTEKSALVELFDSRETRNLAAALAPSDIGKQKSYDLCSMLATILWAHASGAVKTTPIDIKYSSSVEKFVQDPRITELMSKVIKRVPNALGKSLSPEQEVRLPEKVTLSRIILFSIRFHNFMANCSPEFVEKLGWCMPTQFGGYQVTRLSRELPSISKDLTKWFKAGRGTN